MADSSYGRQDFGHGSLNEQLDVDALLREIDLDRSEIDWRKEFVGFDRDDARRLRRYEDVFRDNAEQVADDFYGNLTDHEQTVKVIGRSEKGVEQLKRTQSAYLVTLAGGDYGQEYFRDRARIGKLHDMLDMPMKHYLGQYGVYYDLILPLVGDDLVDRLTDRLTGAVTDGAGDLRRSESIDDAEAAEIGPPTDSVDAIVEAEVDETIRDLLAILRIINLDMQVVTDTYIHSYSRRLEDEIERSERLMRDVRNEVRDPVADLKTTSEDVAGSAGEISETVETTAARMGEISGEVSNLSATVEEVASTADQVERTSDRADALARDGKDAADDATAVMAEIGESVETARDDIDQLQGGVQAIDEFVEAINSIAERTNILALNAQIEAARAGDAGNGFAVVAEEVKSLAEQSQTHANDVERRVEEIKTDTDATVESLTELTERVDEGIDRVQDAMESLTEIVAAVSETADGISEVSNAADDQAASSEEIAAMVDEIVGQAERVAAEIDDLAAANQEQSAMVEEVEDAVAKLTNQPATDGGRPPHAAEAPSDDVSIPEDLPDGMPEFVVESLSDDQLREIARGRLDRSDVL